jgi:Family of unknown function (DUF6941)
MTERPRRTTARDRAAKLPEEPLDGPNIDFFLIADAAEAVGGKLYLLGGGFDRIFVQNFDEPVSFSVALGMLIPWTATNTFHQVTITLQTEDGTVIEPRLAAAFTVGRPIDARQGQSFRAVVAAKAAFKLPGPGTYVLDASLPGAEARRVVFYAISAVSLAPGLPPGFPGPA